MRSLLPLLFAMALCTGRPAVAEQSDDPPAAPALPPPEARGHAASPTVFAAPLTAELHLDGKLDDPAWATATPVSHFTQYDPEEGKPGSERTEVRVLISNSAIYIGARMYESDYKNLRRRLARKDEPVEGDVFAVYFDSRHDHLTAYYFRVTAGGAMRDAVLSNNGAGFDISWDAVWDAKVNRDSLGWTVEIEIPLSQLPYSRDAKEWGIQFERYGWNKQELDQFAFAPKKEQGGVRTFGHLVGLGDLPAPRRLEVLPYVSGRADYQTIDPGDPFGDSSAYDGSAGADLKYRVTGGLTLNATINPDFGQVEVDPAVVNLSAFETFFPEKRPFFVQGQELFTFGQLQTFNSYSFPAVFFSRRIGRAPQRSLADEGWSFYTSPDHTTIAGAAKLTGKTSSGWSIAMIDALTLDEHGRYADTAGAQIKASVEPLTNYFTTRIRREMRQGQTQAGAFLSAVNRDLSDSVLGATLQREAYIGGLDLNHSWNERHWALDASISGSLVRGTTAAIVATQEASRRYYQRPDAKSFSLDSTRTSLPGVAGQLALTRTSGVHWLGNLAYQVTSPGYEANDLGFQTLADRHAVSTDLQYKEDRPNRFLRFYKFEVFTNQAWNFDGDLINNSYSFFTANTLRNFSTAIARFDYSPRVYDDRLTRGGPLAYMPTGYTIYGEYDTDRRNIWTAAIHGQWFHSTANEHKADYGIIFAVQPSSRVRLQFEPRYTVGVNQSQYVTTGTDPLASATYGNRYVFSTIHQREVSMVGRVDWTFTPRLSLQVFLQPLISSGDYADFKELKAPRTYDFLVYGKDLGTVTRSNGVVTIDPDANPGTANDIVFDEPSFNFRSMRGNAVLRWEYLPGSTLFLVWQHQKQDQVATGDFDLGRDISGLWNAPAHNIFAIKVSYWLSR
ncbi:MAG TPA: DUF5916 domain-containing protein [Gemmatimonadales bacterium]|nr:DUF5916 domain-containing protein [Gemmatimonadales bacterium]